MQRASFITATLVRKAKQMVRMRHYSYNRQHFTIRRFTKVFQDLTTLYVTKGTETTCNLNQKLYYHVTGTKQSEDILVAEFPDHPKWHSSATVSNCVLFIIIICWQWRFIKVTSFKRLLFPVLSLILLSRYQMMEDMLFCPSLRAVSLSTSFGTVTFSSSPMASQVCIFEFTTVTLCSVIWTVHKQK